MDVWPTYIHTNDGPDLLPGLIASSYGFGSKTSTTSDDSLKFIKFGNGIKLKLLSLRILFAISKKLWL